MIVRCGAFEKESMYGNSMRTVRAFVYEEYFGQTVFAVRS